MYFLLSYIIDTSRLILRVLFKCLIASDDAIGCSDTDSGHNDVAMENIELATNDCLQLLLILYDSYRSLPPSLRNAYDKDMKVGYHSMIGASP